MAKISREKQLISEARSIANQIPDEFSLTVEDALLLAGELKGQKGVLGLISHAFCLGYSRHKMKRSGEIMRWLREEQSSKEVAEALGITRDSLLAYERGAQTPRDEVKTRIAKYYGIPVDTLFE